MNIATLKQITRASLLVLIGAGLGFGGAHLAYRRERAQLIQGYYLEISERPDLAWLKTADPLADFRNSESNGHIQFIGVRGTLGARFVPGVDHTLHSKAIAPQGIQYLPTSASCFPNEVNPDLNRAIGYASAYNALVLYQLHQ